MKMAVGYCGVENLADLSIRCCAFEAVLVAGLQREELRREVWNPELFRLEQRDEDVSGYIFDCKRNAPFRVEAADFWAGFVDCARRKRDRHRAVPYLKVSGREQGDKGKALQPRSKMALIEHPLKLASRFLVYDSVQFSSRLDLYKSGKMKPDKIDTHCHFYFVSLGVNSFHVFSNFKELISQYF